MRFLASFLPVLCALLVCSPARADEEWPDLSRPAQAVGGGEHDAAVVVGVEGYAFVPPVPGAESNAKAWYDYLTSTRGSSAANVKLLLNNDAAREDILEAAQKAAAKVGPDGTLWFVFIGHGAPGADGKDGLLVGVDAQQKAESLQTHSVKRGELLKALSASHAAKIVVVLDACFSGRGPDGATIAPGLQPLVTVAPAGAIDPRMAVLTAAKGDQFAGPLPGTQRPAFSYLVLGGLRGWAGKASVTAADLWRYAGDALEATLTGRNQTPDLLGDKSELVGKTAGEKGPDLAALAKATAGGGGFQVTRLPSVAAAQAPKALGADSGAGLDFRNLDIEALKKKSAAVELDESAASAEEKAAGWRKLAAEVPKFADLAKARAEEWDRYAAQQKAVEEARLKRVDARDTDWDKLSQLLALNDAVVPEAQKKDWSGKFLRAYLKSPGLQPWMAKVLAEHTAPGATRNSLKAMALKAAKVEAASVTEGKAGIQWVTIPGGTFTMGDDGRGYGSVYPHAVTVKSFRMAKTLVTNKQYNACVADGACTPVHIWEKENRGDDQPVIWVTWHQAKAFSEWVGGRLPSEAEWEYAARSAGKDRKYPWGNSDATCEKAVTRGCSTTTRPVCSAPAGNTEQGLCDMEGNVAEWVADRYHEFFKDKGAPTDGSAWEERDPDPRFRRAYVLCGSPFSAEPRPVTTRQNFDEDDPPSSGGFRPAASR